MPRPCSSASLPHSADTSIEFTEDMTNALLEITNFMRRKQDFDSEHDNLGKRLDRRHNSALEASNSNDEKPEWENVCGHEGEWSGDEMPDELTPDYVQLYLKTLRKSINLEYKALKRNGLHDIDIDDMRAWGLHERKYIFLPTLDHNSPIAPACWHQGMQTFTASLAYLHKIQQQLDHQHYRTQSGLAHELHALLQSSKRVLCEIETIIRATFPHDKRNLKLFTREEMIATIHFYTNESMHRNSRQRNVNRTDLRFVKFFYQNYLLRISELLAHRHNNNHIGLQYTCEEHTHHMMLDTTLKTDAPNASSGIRHDAGM